MSQPPGTLLLVSLGGAVSSCCCLAPSVCTVSRAYLTCRLLHGGSSLLPGAEVETALFDRRLSRLLY